MILTASQSATLVAAIDRIVPADDWPSASQAGVVRFLHELFDTDRAADIAWLLAGLDGLDAEANACHGKSFAICDAEWQDPILAAVEAGEVSTAWSTPPGPFFQLLLDVTTEGYYGDTAHQHVPESWKMLGYDIGANRP